MSIDMYLGILIGKIRVLAHYKIRNTIIITWDLGPIQIILLTFYQSYRTLQNYSQTNTTY